MVFLGGGGGGSANFNFLGAVILLTQTSLMSPSRMRVPAALLTGRNFLAHGHPGGRVRNARIGCTPRGSCNNTLLRRVLRRFSNNNRFLGGVLRRRL